MPVVVGFSFPATHDPAVAVVVDGRLVFAAEEERYTRRKHAPGQLPFNSLLEALRFLTSLGINPEDVDAFALPFDLNYWRRRDRFTVFMIMAKSVTGADYMPGYSRLGRLSIESLFRHSAQEELARVFLKKVYNRAQRGFPSAAKIVPVVHHLAHAASAFCFSGFTSSAVLTVDGNGETDSTVVWKAKDGEFERISTINMWEGSLGFVYSAVGERLGFDFFEAPGKVMGLAPYGKRDEMLVRRFARILDSSGGKAAPYAFRGEFTRHKEMYAKIADFLTAEMNLSWEPRKEVHGPAADLAWSLQNFLETAILAVARWAKEQTSEKSLAISGGVALNAKANMELYYSGMYDDIFVFPAANDGGTPAGAAAFVYQNSLGGRMIRQRLDNVYLGPRYDGDFVKNVVRKAKWPAEFIGDDAGVIGEIVAAGKSVAWFQGRSELGPRALGGRSIIADPTKREMWAAVNEIKGREFWRPLAPSILDASKNAYLESPRDDHDSMIVALRLTSEGAVRIPAVCHVDGTTRPQVVSPTCNPGWYEAIKSFGGISGENALINTSFNLAGEPLVETPQDALRSFALGGIDALFLQGWLLKKG